MDSTDPLVLNTGPKIASTDYLTNSMRQAVQMIALGRSAGAKELLEVSLHVYHTSVERAEKEKSTPAE